MTKLNTDKLSKPYLSITSNYSGFIDDEKLLSVKNLAISLLFLNELITEEGIKTDFSDHTLLSRGCSISGWRVVGAFGLGESSSEANLAENIDADTDPGGVAEGCRPIGSANTSCVWGSHLCMSTQEYCCD